MAKTIHWVLFHADPSLQPPFPIEIGFSENGNRNVDRLENCKHIPDGVEKIKVWVKNSEANYSEPFRLLYPIYLQAMGSDSEDTMHQVAWLIKDEADKNGWDFNRVNGLDGKTKEDFYED